MSAAVGRLVSVIVPTLQEQEALPRTLDHLAALPGRFEVVVSDGGSTDRTRDIAERHPVVSAVVRSEPGRGRQMNEGAARADGEILVFLHADTRLPQGAYRALCTAVARGARGGNFALRFDGGGLFAAFLGAVYRLHRLARVFYGDSAIWATRSTFDEVGGYRDIPIMEDVEFARALHRSGRVDCLPGPAVTSSRRWREAGIVRTVAIWITIRCLYVAGVSPRRLAGLYRRVR